MKKNVRSYYTLLLAFFLAVLSLGTVLCYFQMHQSLDKEIHSRLEQAITSLDVTLGHAELAGVRAQDYLGESCNEGVLTGLRTIVATIPDVRTVNLARHNKIYCTSVFGGKNFTLIQSDFPDGSLKLMGGNQITPSKSLIVYTLQDRTGNSALVGIDGYYLQSILNMLEGNSRLFMKVGDRYIDSYGHVSTSPAIALPVELTSDLFRYTVIADRAVLVDLSTFITYERNLFIAILVVSLLLTWLLRNYLLYRSTLEFMLRRAIKQKQLKPYIQPIVDGEDGEIVGGEVLIRWEHPKLGFIPPDKFISVAEQTGLIKEVTAICFEEVSQHLQHHRLPENLFICFNVSSINLQDDEIVTLCSQFPSRLKGLKMRVVLEITERESFGNTRKLESVTKQLRELGVHFSLDDFGTGHANYSYLQQFKPEFIKIDKVFTSNVRTNTTSALVVKNMVNLGSKFSCRIIAEGVEDYDQLQTLKKLGINTFQGFYFFRPVSVDDYIRACQKDSEKRGEVL